MTIIDNISRMKTFLGMVKKENKTIGFVPTMGSLHEGHLSMARTAKNLNDVVVMSIFVNPAQFGPNEDFESYPRDIKRDEELASNAGVDVIFYPSVKDMYPEGYGTYINVERLTETLCGAKRPGHFRGVATVVAKLFNIVKPDIAYFGQKDAQQVAVIKKMVKDLNIDLSIKVLPTVREKDGLAMSSRNKYLSSAERLEAAVLNQALSAARIMVERGETSASQVIQTMGSMIKVKPGANIDYISIVDPDTLNDVQVIRGPALVALAVYIGKTRLIDNIVLEGKGK
jgi:pantoate--beta-alanine ligase